MVEVCPSSMPQDEFVTAAKLKTTASNKITLY